MNEILMNADKLFDEVKGDFTALWQMKQRGETLEFIAPYATLAGEFISVFLTQRENGFVVSDGGRLKEIADEQEVDLEAKTAIHHEDLLDKYAVRETSHGDGKRCFHYKIATSFQMLSACVYDVVRFHEAVANAIYIDTLFDDDETSSSQYFKTRVKNVLYSKSQQFSALGKKYELFSDDDIQHYHFTTGIREVGTSRMCLAMSISRSNLTIYQQMVRNAEFGFLHIRKKWLPEECALTSIIAPLPDSLLENPKALRIAGDMEGWKADYEVNNLSYGQVENMNTMDLVFGQKIA